MMSAASIAFFMSLTNLGREDQPVSRFCANIYLPDMRQHDDSRFFRLDLVNRLEVIHIADTVDDGVDLSGKGVTMPHGALLSPELYLPTRVEDVGAREYNVGVV